MTKLAYSFASIGMVGALMVGYASVASAEPSLPAQHVNASKQNQNKEFHGEKYDSPDGKHWVKISEKYVELGALEGESVSVKGNQAIWKDANGKNVSVMTFSPEDPSEFSLTYDPETHRLGDSQILHHSNRSKRCATKWQAAGLNVMWDGLVCGPLTMASAGTLAAGCGFIGTLGAAAISC